MFFFFGAKNVKLWDVGHTFKITWLFIGSQSNLKRALVGAPQGFLYLTDFWVNNILPMPKLNKNPSSSSSLFFSEPGVDRWQLGAWFQIYIGLEDEGTTCVMFIFVSKFQFGGLFQLGQFRAVEGEYQKLSRPRLVKSSHF